MSPHPAKPQQGIQPPSHGESMGGETPLIERDEHRRSEAQGAFPGQDVAIHALAPLAPTSTLPEITFDQELPPSSSSRRILDVALAASMLVVSAPILGLATLMVRVIDGGPVFYRGTRLGRGARPFTLMKIRSLKTDAESKIGGSLLTDSHNLKTRTGAFLRDTRLDELPQLMHVIRGDMNLFGPRPERPEVYREKCATLPRYAERFLVRPGVFGYSQILTPHGTPKRLRAVIDRQFVHAPRSSSFDITLLGLTLGALLQETGVRIGRFGASQWQQRILGRYRNQRRERRVRPSMPASVSNRSYDGDLTLELRDLTSTSFCTESTGLINVSKGAVVTLLVHQPNSHIVRRARVEIVESIPRVNSDGSSVVAIYKPRSENSQYVIEQYLMNKSIVRLPDKLRRRRPKPQQTL